MKQIFVWIFSFSIAIQCQSQLVINEISQGSSADEYLEFLVVGIKTCADSCADLRGWILDDNNGWHAQGSGVGIAPGCIRLRNIPQWSCVPFGTVILLYSSSSKNPAITAANDPTDANGDKVYIIPFNNATVIDKDTINPNSGNNSYAVFTLSSAIPITGWGGVVGMRNGGDVFHTVDAANFNSAHHTVGWGDNNQLVDVYFAGNAGGKVYSMKNGTSNDPYLQANWVSEDVATAGTQTPGTGNNAANIAWINALKNQVSSSSYYDSLGVSICQGQNYVTPSGPKSVNGIFRDTLSSVSGCDSIIITNLQILQSTLSSLSLQGCDSVLYQGTKYTSDAAFIDTLTGIGGCDSLYLDVSISVLTPTTTFDAVCILQGDSAFLQDAFRKTPGTFTDTIAIGNCYNIVITDLQVVNPSNNIQNFEACNSYFFNGQTYTSSVVLRDTVQSALRCDSIYNITNITIKYPPVTVTKNVCINQGESYFAQGANQTIAGNYYETIAAANGCDSAIITNLSVVTPVVINNTLSGCSQVTFNGITYTNDTLLIDTVTTLLGCDSSYTNTTISVNNLFTTTNNNICIYQGDSYFAGGGNQTTSGIYTDNYLLPSGCDSTVITDLRVVNPITLTNTVSGCNQVTYNGVDYFSNTTISQILSTSFGCDSVYLVTDIVVLFDANSSIIDVCIKQGDSYFAGGGFQTTSGVYQDIYSAANGCDSTVQTILNVVSPSSTNVNLDFCDVGSYKGVSYFSDTNFVDLTSSVQGCDSVILNVSINIHPTIIYTITASKPMPIQEGESVVLNSNLQGTSPYYVWSPNSGIVSGGDQATVTVAPTTDTKYTMDFFAADSFCKSVDEFLVTVTKKNTPDPAFTIPTAFSPNGDGANDMLTPILQDGLVIEEFRIFNRWGELVFEETGSSSGWNGEYKGVKQPMGVYVYYLSVRNSFNSTLKSKAGSITLLR
jgi:gliding motility-associated-like protein